MTLSLSKSGIRWMERRSECQTAMSCQSADAKWIPQATEPGWGRTAGTIMGGQTLDGTNQHLPEEAQIRESNQGLDRKTEQRPWTLKHQNTIWLQERQKLGSTTAGQIQIYHRTAGDGEAARHCGGGCRDRCGSPQQQQHDNDTVIAWARSWKRGSSRSQKQHLRSWEVNIKLRFCVERLINRFVPKVQEGKPSTNSQPLSEFRIHVQHDGR